MRTQSEVSPDWAERAVVDASELADIRCLLDDHYAYYLQPLPPAVSYEWARDLLEFSHEAIARVLYAHRKRQKFPARPADIVNALDPEPSDADEAIDIANAIFDAISTYGRTNADLAEKKLGPVAWAVASRLGNWVSLCMATNAEDRGTFIAQTRSLALSVLAKRPNGLWRDALPPKAHPDLAAKRTSDVESLGQLLAKVGHHKAETGA